MAPSLKKEILRKFFHLMEVPAVLVYSLIRHFWSEQAAAIALTALLLLLLEIEYIRLEVKPKLPRVLNVFRARERNNVTSMVFFVAATIISFGTFDYDIALLALLLTVFGDLVSALVGIKFGRHILVGKKTWEGFLAGLVMNIIVGFLVIPSLPVVFIPMALVASLVEVLTNKLDDNITVPLFAGFSGQMIVYALNITALGFPGPLADFFKLFY